MNPIPQCFQKILPGNHFRTYGTYVRMYVQTYGKGDAICPPPFINGGGIKKELLLTPRVKGVCKGKTFASRLLYASFLLTLYATRPYSEKLDFI